ncbi:MAG: hypothetical protein M1389_05710 [Chloroflexi bacterium]|nr:hypothetical protein [Chloroflexota bacterium]
MTQRIVVQIVGAPTACADGVKDSWREVAAWAAGQLKARFGDAVQVDYFDLFDPGAPPIPPGAQLPLVLAGGEMVSQGAKVSIPAIRRRVESMLESGEPQSTPGRVGH